MLGGEQRHLDSVDLGTMLIDEQDRIRQHMRIFVNHALVKSLATPLADGDEVHVFQALSGG